MSRIKVNEISTLTGTDITIETGKTLTGTASQFKITGGTAGQALITDGSGGISFGAVDSLPTQSGNADKFLKTDGTTATWETVSHDPTMAGDLTGTASNAQIAAGAVSGTEVAATFDISSKTVTLPAASVTAHVTQFDDNNLKEDIALLGFQVASNGSLAKYNLVDQTSDSFESTAGLDLSTSTGEYHNTTSKFMSGAEAAGWFVGDRMSGANLLTVSSDMPWHSGENSIQYLVNGVTTYDAAGGAWFDAGGTGYIRFDHGAGNSKVYTNSRWTYNQGTSEGLFKWQGSNDASSWTDIGGTWTLGNTNNSTVQTDTHGTMTANTTSYRYYQAIYVSGAATNGGGRRLEMQFYGSAVTGNMILVSTATTALAAPTKGDIVLTWSDGVGTSVLANDISAEFSADNGSNWTPMTLANQGTTGTHNIATAHDVTRTSASGTAMRYRVKTLNQSATKETRIHAVALGWS